MNKKTTAGMHNRSPVIKSPEEVNITLANENPILIREKTLPPEGSFRSSLSLELSLLVLVF